MSYIILRGRWCHIIVLNVHAPTEDKTDDEKDSFYEELEGVFDKFHKYHMKILLTDFNAKVGRENTCATISTGRRGVIWDPPTAHVTMQRLEHISMATMEIAFSIWSALEVIR
jgi:hypothetical protein